MGKAHHPRRGSMQYWPRKRSSHNLAKIRSWAEQNNSTLLGFIGYKVGMTHILGEDISATSPTKGETIHQAVTIVECPPMKIIGASLYKGQKKVGQISSKGKKVEDYQDFDEIKIIVESDPYKVNGLNTKKKKVLEIALGGKLEEKINYFKENLEKEIKITDLFKEGEAIDVHGVTKGKGTQGTVKRFGVPIRAKKSEKTKRGIGNLGAWTPKRVLFNVAQAGKMGYHLRTEYNKSLVVIDNNVERINPKGGFNKYGLVKNDYVLIKGSLVGPQKRALVITKPIRLKKPVKVPKVIQIRK
jgi:large subunit ribosomal protein L3